MDELRERIETDLIKRVFHVTVPEIQWDEFFTTVDSFCKTYYGDVRWIMVKDLIENAQTDWKYASLFDEIEMLKAKVADLESKKGVDVNQKPSTKTFGSEVMKNVTGDRYE